MKFILVYLSCFISFLGLHNYHNSITKVELDQKEQLAKITVQLFTEDLYQLIDERFKKSPKKLDKFINTDNEEFLNYFQNKIQLTINRKPIDLILLGIQEEQNYSTLYIQGKISKKPQRIEFTNGILTDIFSDQLNTSHITLGNVTKSVHLGSLNPSGILFFDTTKE